MPGIRRFSALTTALCAALAVAGVFTLWAPARSNAQGTPTVRVELERPNVNVGDEFDVFIYVEGASSLGGFQFTLAFDETYLQYVDAEVTDWLGSTGRTVTPMGPARDPGVVSLGAVSVGPVSQPGPDGEGDLASVRFEALTEGQTELDLTEVLLVTTSNQRIEVEGEGGLVVIGGAGTAVPTVTASSTPVTPGPTTPSTPGTATATAGITPPVGPYNIYLPAAYRSK